MSCFSFYANKIITTGEGGMVLTNSKDILSALVPCGIYALGPKSDFIIPSLVTTFE